MGSSFQPDTPEVRLPDDAPPPPYVMPASSSPPVRPEPRLRYVVLFLMTVATTTIVGTAHYAGFFLAFKDGELPFTSVGLLMRGLWYSASIIAILGAHEFGHYFACRYYGVNASLPYFLPLPITITGTLGAFIRIRQPIRSKRHLFDIGIAGPIAGFLVAVPVLMIGMYLSSVVEIPKDFTGVELGEPLLFKAATWLTFGSIQDGYTVNMHPMAFAAWFGLLATALNLFPMGQLDGGHISYAVLGRKSTMVTIGTIACLVALTFISVSWILWTVLTVGMLFAFGLQHPQTYDEGEPLDRGRVWLALFAMLMFILCFTPAPMQPLDLVRTR